MFADWPSLLGRALCLGAGGPPPGVPCVVDGDGVGGETIKVRVSIVGVGAQGLMRENVSEVLGEIKLTNHGGGRDR